MKTFGAVIVILGSICGAAIGFFSASSRAESGELVAVGAISGAIVAKLVLVFAE